ncbi:MAG: relaxase/mobilization nuclease domain-containing protein [Desulfobacterales bacterium]|nr:relaxase/mobilization nuclease domain-containing protein [Desulfobacterales bacterium]
MKGNVNRGSGFRGVMTYLMNKKLDMKAGPPVPRPGSLFIPGNMGGTNPRAIAQEFGISRSLRPECNRPVWHCSLSLPAGETMTAERWQDAGAKLLHKIHMDPDLHQWVMVKHTDTNYEHCHLIVSRIGLDGSIWHGKWDARAVHEATQEIEIEMNLIRTPGPGPKGPGESGPHVNVSKKERKMWEKRGIPEEMIPRLAIAVALESAIKNGDGTLEHLKAEMALDKIGVHVNEASTGRISGVAFSMEVDGEVCRYKASQIHKDYAWKTLGARLEERREAYEREQWGEENHLSERESNGQASVRPGDSRAVSDGDLDLARELSDLARVTGGDRPATEAPGRNAADFGQLDRGAAGSDQRVDAGNSGVSDAGHGTGDRSAASPDPGPGPVPESDRELVNEFGQGAQFDEQTPSSNPGGDRRSGRLHGGPGSGHPAPGAWSPGDRSGDRSDFQPDHADRDSIHAENLGDAPKSGMAQMSWNDRFKKASAARRREAAGEGPAPVPAHEIQNARAVDPKPVLEKYGFEVRQVGKQYSIRQGGDEIYRATFKDGHWVHCDHYGGGVGDNIALIQYLDPGKNFADAVFTLHGAPAFNPQSAPDLKKLRPVLPACNSWAEARGRDYLLERGISVETIDAAEAAGFLAYTMDGILTLGRDPQGGEIRAITRRAWDDNAEMPKRDLRHSNKVEFPPVLPGAAVAVVVVEGGIDALAVHDMCRKQDKPLPTVIVSGSAEAQGFLEQPHIQKILKNVEKITVCYENEDREKTQIKTDAAHDKQMNRIRELAPQTAVQKWRPPTGCKDAADVNAAMVIEPDPASESEQDYNNGPSLAK